jgi:hypothetical protein
MFHVDVTEAEKGQSFRKVKTLALRRCTYVAI